MELNLYEINEFNKEMKKLNDSLNNEDNNKILEYAQNKKQELNEELKEINVEQIKNNGNLTAQEWLKKDFLEKEINKHEETISKIETERENNKKVILEKNLQKEDMKRQLKLQEAQIEIELADIQKIWNEAITELNSNNEQIKQLRIANKDLSEDSEEAQNNLNEILKLQNKNDELKEVMKENVVTSKKGIEIRNKQEDIKAMINILDSGYILENVKNPNEEKESEQTKPVQQQPVQQQPVQQQPAQQQPAQQQPVQQQPAQQQPVQQQPVQQQPVQQQKQTKTHEPKNIPISKDTIKIELDANSGLAVLSRRIDGMEYHVNRSLEKIFDRKEEKAIRKKVIERLIEQDKGDYAKSVKRLSRKLNPAVLELLCDEEPELMEQYIEAVQIGDKEKLPFDKYNIKLNDGVTIDEKSFTRLNRYAVRDNKNLGTEFNATPWYTVKKALNKVLPKKLPFMKKWIGELPEPAKLNDQEALIRYSQAKEKRDAIKEQSDEKNNLAKLGKEEINKIILEQKRILNDPNSSLADRTEAKKLLQEAQKNKTELRDAEVKNERGAKGTSEGLRAALRYDVPVVQKTPTQIIDKDKAEENTNNKKNKFKESLKVGKNSLSKVHHYTSKKLNNIKMNGKIASRRITGYLKGENPYKVQMDVKNIEEDYMSR